MATELDNLTVELNSQLFDLCGESEDDFQTCEAADAAEPGCPGRGLPPRWAGLDAGPEPGRAGPDEEERAGHVIRVRLGLGKSCLQQSWHGRAPGTRNNRYAGDVFGGKTSRRLGGGR